MISYTSVTTQQKSLTEISYNTFKHPKFCIQNIEVPSINKLLLSSSFIYCSIFTQTKFTGITKFSIQI